jgi:FkbM family methyltransferase
MRRVLDRTPRALLLAPWQPRHWRAIRRALRDIHPAIPFLARYVSQRGGYPWTVQVDTPLGRVPVTMHSRHDLLTVNEVFCRLDYGTPEGCVIVDIGANIGISALYFLTRNPACQVWCYEPNPRNVERLRHNLAPYLDRVTITRAAVGSERGRMGFLVEPTGRYGRLLDGDAEGNAEQVDVVTVSDVLDLVCRGIDFVKIDTEGTKPELVAELTGKVAAIAWENDRGGVEHARGT